MSDMVEVVIDSIRVHLMAPQRVLVLKQTDAARYLTIWVGPYEAEAITVALQEVEMVRPLTHDLIKNIFVTFKNSLNPAIPEVSDPTCHPQFKSLLLGMITKEDSLDPSLNDHLRPCLIHIDFKIITG